MSADVNTKSVDGRREVRFASLSDILGDAERFSASGEPRTIGNWSAGEIVEHVRMVMGYSREGFPDIGVPAPLRWFITVFLKKRSLTKGFDAGFRFPNAKVASAFTPPKLPVDEAMSRLRREVELCSAAGAMNKPSPLIGALTHEQWEQLHCRHAELHFSFVQPVAAVQPA